MFIYYICVCMCAFMYKHKFVSVCVKDRRYYGDIEYKEILEYFYGNYIMT